MRILATAILALALAATGPVWADDLQDGIAAYDAGDYRGAIGLLQPLADQGVAGAQLYLGLMYDEGDGVEIDDLQAVDWYRRAALQGDLVAQYMLGTMYDFGEGVAEDNAQAVIWYRMAAKQEHGYATLLVESYSKFQIVGDVLEYNSNISEVSLIDPEWLQDILLSNPGITTVQLTSDGGDVLAAYPMAAVIADFGLDTHVEGDCVSACAFVFLGGLGRTMGNGARLGFHQTAWEADNMRIFYDEAQVDYGW
ncbi:MAG: hypothetical protein HOB82_09185, partial [Alphaproteobacteria bacterium]|nr:hypothetical protein [Alphaproteobacteria bacterium]